MKRVYFKALAANTFVYLFMGLQFLCLPALAEPAMDIAPIGENKALTVTESKSFSGACGTSTVSVYGVVDFPGSYFRVDYDVAKIIVRSSLGAVPKTLSLTAETGVISDRNGVACVASAKGARLLIWSQCAGTQCVPEFVFFVVDPARLVFLTPRSGCNAKCASRLLGSRKPQELNAAYLQEL